MSGTSNTRLKKHIGGLPKLDLVRTGDPGQELEHHTFTETLTSRNPQTTDVAYSHILQMAVPRGTVTGKFERVQFPKYSR